MSKRVSEWRTTAAGVVVHAYSICGTDCMVLAAYEPRAGHGTWMSGPNGEPLGVLSTRPCPAHITREGLIADVRGEHGEYVTSSITAKGRAALEGSR